MKLTNQEAGLIAYALNMLALDKSDVILATTAEINDLSARVITNTIKENR